MHAVDLHMQHMAACSCAANAITLSKRMSCGKKAHSLSVQVHVQFSDSCVAIINAGQLLHPVRV